MFVKVMANQIQDIGQDKYPGQEPTFLKGFHLCAYKEAPKIRDPPRSHLPVFQEPPESEQFYTIIRSQPPQTGEGITTEKRSDGM